MLTIYQNNVFVFLVKLTMLHYFSPLQINSLVLSIDGANRTLSARDGQNAPFTYMQDPTVMEIKPLKSFVSGGRMITVHGTNLDTIQKPEMVVYTDSSLNPINKSVSLYCYL